MRCFIGLPLPEEYQQKLQDLIKIWKPRLQSRLSWTKPGNWHMTLKFLGEIPNEAVEPIVQALGESLGKSFILQAGNGGFFPNQFRPRVIWVGVHQGGEACRALAREVEQRLALLGQSVWPGQLDWSGRPPEARAFTPHLTVARIKEARPDPPDPLGELLDALHAAKWPEARMDRVVLWASQLTPAGPHYRPMAEFGLA
jgi:2'-5' RNA ligase